jgi:hypothetical protein
VRDLDPADDRDVALSELENGLLEILHAIYEDWSPSRCPARSTAGGLVGKRTIATRGMSNERHSVHEYPPSPAEVWRALTDPELIALLARLVLRPVRGKMLRTRPTRRARGYRCRRQSSLEVMPHFTT